MPRGVGLEPLDVIGLVLRHLDGGAEVGLLVGRGHLGHEEGEEVIFGPRQGRGGHQRPAQEDQENLAPGADVLGRRGGTPCLERSHCLLTLTVRADGEPFSHSLSHSLPYSFFPSLPALSLYVCLSVCLSALCSDVTSLVGQTTRTTGGLLSLLHE